MKKSYFQAIKTNLVFYFIIGLGTLSSACGGSSSNGPSPTTSPTPTPTPTSAAVVKCPAGQLCPPSNISVVNAKS